MPKRGHDAAADGAALTSTAKRRDTRDATTGIASLSSSLLELVWSFAFNTDTSEELFHPSNVPLLQVALHNARRVSPQWNTAVKEMIEKRYAHVAVLDIASAATSRPIGTNPKLEINIPRTTTDVTDLVVFMGHLTTGRNFKDQATWEEDQLALFSTGVRRADVFTTSAVDVDWAASLSSVANTLTRLDLSRMLLYIKHVGDLLRAAARLCPNVKEVLLPCLETREHRDELTRLANMEALSDALRSWHRSNGGLRHLRVPFLGRNLMATERFLKDVTMYCPSIELLDGEVASFSEQCSGKLVVCEMLLHVSPPVWRDFWTTCTKLRRWNTVVMPFEFEYFQTIVDSAPREHVTELVLSHNTVLMREDEKMGGDLFLKVTARFPKLRKLQILFSDEVKSDEWSPRTSFDAKYLEWLATSCTHLEELVIRHRSGLAITTTSISTLLSMRELKNVELGRLDVVQATPGELAAVVVKSIEDKRHLSLRLTVENVEDAMWEVLEAVKSLTPIALNGAALSLRLQTRETFGFVLLPKDEINGQRHAEAAVERLVKELKQTHGDRVRVHLHVTRPIAGMSDCVRFDSLEFAVNSPQSLECSRPRQVYVDNVVVEQTLCGDRAFADGMFVREAEGSMEQALAAKRRQSDVPMVSLPGVASDSEVESVGSVDGDEDFDDDDDNSGSGSDSDGGEQEDEQPPECKTQ